MANRNFKRVQSLDNETKIVSGNFSVASGTPTKVAGLGWTVAGTGTGEFTVTLDDTYPVLLSAQVSIEAAGGITAKPEIDSHDVGSAKTVVINTTTAGSPAAVDCTIHFLLVLRNSTVA